MYPPPLRIFISMHADFLPSHPASRPERSVTSIADEDDNDDDSPIARSDTETTPKRAVKVDGTDKKKTTPCENNDGRRIRLKLQRKS